MSPDSVSTTGQVAAGPRGSAPKAATHTADAPITGAAGKDGTPNGGGEASGGRHGDGSPADRWRLHRGGIINIWQYAEHTFDLSGGRGVFQGTNGSGKSRTLELLLPLCLDGDLRQLGSKGFDTVSMRRLMLDEYPGGPNRIGYAWVELRRSTPDGVEEFLTCGVGIKASKTAQAISDSWRFITSRRVGHDLHLVTPERVPLSATQLRETLGADRVLDEQTFRARIAATVYGMPAARYGDLLHLQRTLRNPDVGLKVLEGQLETILADALPPLDPALIERLATSFDDLESIRENILGLTDADRALRTFLRTYSGYAFGVLRDRARAMRDARARLRALRTEITELEQQHTEEQRQRATAENTVTELEQRDGELEASIDALRAHPAYTELQNLRDRERLVESSRSAAITALDTASKHRTQEGRSADSVVSMLRRLAEDANEAETHAQRAANRLSAAGLRSELAPQPPHVTAVEATTERAEVRTSAEPDAEPLAVDRSVPPRVASETLAEQFHTTGEATQRAADAARERAALTLNLQERARQLDREREQVVDAQRRARQAQLAATDAGGRRNQAEQNLTTAIGEWVQQVQQWNNDWPGDDAEPPEPPTENDLLTERATVRRARERAREWGRPRLNQARQHVAGLEQHVAELYVQARTWEDELAELRAGWERVPERPSWVNTSRAERTGRAFYQLVDFTPELDGGSRAGLEAALQASGLLNAWVDPAGTPHGVADLLADESGDRPSTSLDTLLVPAPEPGCPVPTERIARLLEQIGANSGEPAAGLAVSTDGAWRAGVLRGAWDKYAAEFVGAGARAAARINRITRLEDDLAQLHTDIGIAEQRHHEASEHVTALERHLEAFPGEEDLLAAHAKLSNAQEAVRDAESSAVELREQYEQADQRWQAAHAELTRAAAGADLPADTTALEQANRAASEAVSAIDALRSTIETRCQHTLNDLRDLLLRHDAAIADRMAAEDQAAQRSAEYAEQAAGLTELTDAVDGTAQDIAGKISALEDERAQVRGRLPAERERVSALRESTARLETQTQHRNNQLTGHADDVERAATSFRAALRTPGLWAAARLGADRATDTADVDGSGADADGATAAVVDPATPSDEPPDPERAARLVLDEQRRAASEATVLNRLQELQQSLSAGYDVSAGEQDEVLTVTITGDEGPQPVAEAAVRITERLTEQRGYLNERYRSIFADYLIRDLADRLRQQIDTADRLCARMNEVLDGARSSQGVHVQLDWRPSTALDEDIRRAIDVVRTPLAERSSDEDAMLRRVFTKLIESERDSAAGGYAEVLSRALDYRAWFTFTVRVRDVDPAGKARVRRLRQLSSGETRLISYVTLFAAAAAFYDAVSVPATDLGPLRLVLLDEAFERLDEPTVARMLELLVDLDMDWLITWPSGWGVSPKIPRMHIYDVLRPRSGHGIACTHTVWDGRELERPDW